MSIFTIQKQTHRHRKQAFEIFFKVVEKNQKNAVQ